MKKAIMKKLTKSIAATAGCATIFTTVIAPVSADKLYVNQAPHYDATKIEERMDDLHERFVYVKEPVADGEQRTFSIVLCDEYRQKAEEFIAAEDWKGLYEFLKTEVYVFTSYTPDEENRYILRDEPRKYVEADDYEGLCAYYQDDGFVPNYPFEIYDIANDIVTIGQEIAGVQLAHESTYPALWDSSVSPFTDVCCEAIGEDVQVDTYFIGFHFYRLLYNVDSDYAYDKYPSELINRYVRGEDMGNQVFRPLPTGNANNSTGSSPSGLPPKEQLIPGDVDLDGIVSLSDVVNLQKHVTLGEGWIEYASILNGDCNGDGKRDTVDISILTGYLCGKIKALPCKDIAE